MIEVISAMSWEAQFPSNVVTNLLRHGNETFGYTKEFYEVRNLKGEVVLVAGVALWNFVRPPELWLALAKPYFVNLRDSLKVTGEALEYPKSRFNGLVCDVLKSNKTEQHFVRYFGWKPTGQPSLRPSAELYTQFGIN